MKILITGSRGMLATQIITDLRRGYTELGKIPSRFISRQVLKRDIDELDITDIKAVDSYIGKTLPDILINCAAYTNVDGCESDKEGAFRLNALGPRNLAIVCKKYGTKLVHISTDYVFSGVDDTLLTEYDLPHPVSVYGKTKYAGERYVSALCPGSFIIRTSWLYGYSGKNFVRTMLSLFGKGVSPKVVDDQHGSPTNAADLSHHILKIASTEEYGLYHCTGNGQCTWYEFACEISRLSGKNIPVQPCTSREYPTPAKRPRYSYLDNMMLRVTVGDEMRDWRDALAGFFENLEE